jgi:hypothetical protein
MVWEMEVVVWKIEEVSKKDNEMEMWVVWLSEMVAVKMDVWKMEVVWV